MFGLFQKKAIFGHFDILFPDKNSAFVIDSIPEEVPGHLPKLVCDLWFTTFFIGKMLFNFPGRKGSEAVEEALTNITTRFNRESNDGAQVKDGVFPNVSLLGTFLPHEIKLLSEAPNTGKKYSAILFKQGDNILVKTKVAIGHENYYHRAALDVVMETERRKLGANGSAVVTAVIGLLSSLLENDTSNIGYNLHMAASSAVAAAGKFTDLSAMNS